MKVSESVSYKIGILPSGLVFTSNDFSKEASTKEAVVKALNRMVGKGEIAKLAKGKFYKPEKSPFGELLPSQSEIIKDLLEHNGKRIGYLTGINIFNQLGLTTQISRVVQIGRNGVRPRTKRMNIEIEFVEQKNQITPDNVKLLQILDAIRFIKKIPDIDTVTACKRLLVIVGSLTEKEKGNMVRLSKKYPPASRSLLGLFLEESGHEKAAEPLFKMLNPLTKYRITGVAGTFPASNKWQIV